MALNSLDVGNFLKGKCVLVSSGNIIHMSITSGLLHYVIYIL